MNTILKPATHFFFSSSQIQTLFPHLKLKQHDHTLFSQLNQPKKKKILNPEKHISSKLKPSKPRFGGLEHLIGPELRGVAGLERFDSSDEVKSSAA